MAPQYIDHIIYAADDLDAAADTIAALLGVRPVFGGQHLGVGTHNALLSLGPRTYLEVIAPDPNQPEPAQPRSFGIDTLAAPALVTWAASSNDIVNQVAAAKAAGYDAGTVVDGGRKTPEGQQLAWRSAKHANALVGQLPPGDGLVPFLIDWGDTPQPATVVPSGGRLVGLRGEHPQAAAISEMLNALGTPIAVTEAPQVQLIATIETADGIVELR